MNIAMSLWRMARYENGFAFKPEDVGFQGLPIVRIRQLVDPDADADFTERSVNPRFLVDDGDLIFSWSASLAVRVWNRGPALLNQHLFKVVPHAGIEKSWLRWILDSSISEFMGMMHGSAMTHLNLDMLKGVQVDVPSPDEQRRIADFPTPKPPVSIRWLKLVDASST